MDLLKNRKLLDVSLNDRTYVLKISIKKSFVEDWDKYFFSMFTRHTGDGKVISHDLYEELDDYYIFQLTISTTEYEMFFTEGETIDLSIVRQRADEEQKARVKSNFDYLEQLQLSMNDSHILYPATTKHGNISFHYRENYLLAKAEAVELSNDSIVDVSGFFQYRGLLVEEIKKLEIVLTSNLNDDIIRIPVNRIDMPKSYANYSWYEDLRTNGFIATIDLKPYMSLGKAQYFKFHMNIEYERQGNVHTIESTRLKVNHLKQKFPINKKMKIDNKKMKITCIPTRKSKYLSLRVTQFILPMEMYRGAKRRWVRLRRSKQLLNIYKMAFFLLGRILPVNKKLVIFESFHGKQFSDNPRAIYEYMEEKNLGYELIWSADRRHVNYFQNKNVPYVRRFSIRWLLLMTRAKYWVTNARLPLWIPKPRRTTYLQTWHGTPLKRLAADMDEVHMPGTNTERYKENFTKEASKWDYLISPNAYSSKIFKRAFQFDKTMIESGYPRNDYLYTSNNEAAINQIKKELTIPAHKKVILYAPTWRDNQFYGRGRYKMGMELELDKLQEAFGDTHVILLRMHYLIADNIDISAYEGFVYDFSKHEDIRDLYLVADLLITDYSSVFFDYANLGRPMLFFVYDIDEYRDNLRGFYFDFEHRAPGPLVKTTDEVIDEILKLEKDGFIPSPIYEAFRERFCYLEDGNASERVVKKIFK